MNCPHCGKEIDDKMIAKHLARKGGSKSKRILTTKQAISMVMSREAKKDNEEMGAEPKGKKVKT